ncbi:3-methyladenine DNA glycosylase [uncultured Pseudomonas sp.]|uniref:3-methyladenine DNA glycosylase n=1 Tax=uncultured Pseudomonas sp. TaxID=114707 RepID=UPI00258B5DFA|nr:3-methyladenine DNA glycosylase [uncultured Pseudomonas sp.]
MATVRTLGKRFKNFNVNGNAVFIATLIPPADNVNGIILRALTVQAGEVSVGTQVPSGDRFDQTLQRIPTNTTLYNDVLIPAGKGVFLNTTASYTNQVQISWDVLNADGTVA